MRGNGIVEMRPENVDLLSLRGMLKPSIKGITLKDMKEAIRETAKEFGCEAVATFDGDLLKEPGFVST